MPLGLIRFTVCKDTITVLRVLLHKAVRGELRGLALCYRDQAGEDEVMFTGVFRAHPDTAMLAALRIQLAAASDFR